MRAFSISIFLVLILSSVSYACMCGEWDFDFSVNAADEIFLGKIISSETDEYPFFDTSELKYVFEISKKWKGSSSNRIEIFRQSGCAPSLDTKYPAEYIIYAYKSYSQLAEVIAKRFDNPIFYDLDFADSRMTTIACFRLKKVDWHKTEAPFRDEIALLDSAFTKPVTLRPYYINFTNIFFLAWIVVPAGFYFRKKRNHTKSESN
ncbi:MAG: hypothetical protein RLN81_16985 [Balneolaceae bacterium]